MYLTIFLFALVYLPFAPLCACVQWNVRYWKNALPIHNLITIGNEHSYVARFSNSDEQMRFQQELMKRCPNFPFDRDPNSMGTGSKSYWVGDWLALQCPDFDEVMLSLQRKYEVSLHEVKFEKVRFA
ncbi:uncharacterized protein VTP21DRAFT_5304 [Calcarisporiella thermophila]|uniref:uncharacterized protein n=1 Tax=Calcarisporiella thermophila TaxID=911321 RepID=UPI0037420333